MSRTINWHTKAIYLIVVLAFALGLAIVPGTPTAADEPVPPSLVPSPIAYDVKGAIHKVCIDAGGYNLTGAKMDWWMAAGVEITPDDVTIIGPTGPNPDYMGTRLYQDTIKEKGLTDDSIICIAFQAMKRGDIHIYVEVSVPIPGSDLMRTFTLHTEKKWGELCRTELDVNPDMEGVQHTEEVTVPVGATGLYEETITDMVYASFLEVTDCVPAGHAVVHWWLFEDNEDNQLFIDELMDYLADHNGALDDDHWAAHGKYVPTDFGNRQPWEVINDYALLGNHADTDIFDWDDINPAPPGAIWPPGWYAWNTSEDYLPGETPGQAQATLTVDLDMLEPCQPEEVMIVVLVSYPGGTTPQEDPFSGENMVCLEKGKKKFHKIKITQVKTPQIRWAGEKIALEKDWGVEPGVSGSIVGGPEELLIRLDLHLYAAYYTLQEGAVGALEPVSDIGGIMFNIDALVDGVPVELQGTLLNFEYLGLPLGAQAVIAPLGGYFYDIDVELRDQEIINVGMGWGGYPDTAVLLWSQTDGQSDVNAALYEMYVTIEVLLTKEPPGVGEIVFFGANGPIVDHGFLVYFLEFEDVTLAEDITPASELETVSAEEPVDVAVRVRGFFDYRHSYLMATTREEKLIDLNGDGWADKILPAGRYILPDDWWLLAETQDVSLRPNWDLMDMAFHDLIWSDNELGPFDFEVWTIDPPGMAEAPCIGPFSTYQQWSVEDMWISSAMVPSSQWWMEPWLQRNTVVPNGTIDEWDCPMPQALVLFDVIDYAETVDHSLTGLDKGNLALYGIWDDLYQSPFYAVEIPANWLIPPGYNWMSWMPDPGALWWYIPVQGPYDYWTDLQLDSIIADTHEDPVDDQDVEAFCDNHGIAGVTVEPMVGQGYVTITATAEFPYSPKKGKYGPRVSAPITIGSRVDLNPHFVVDKLNPVVDEIVTFDPNATYGGTLPYTELRWDFNGDGYWDEDLVGEFWPGELPLAEWAYDMQGTYYPCLEVTDSSIPEVVRKECMAPPYAIIVGPGGLTIDWYLEYGLDDDPAAVNIWTYPTWGMDVILFEADASMPDGLLIWQYGGPGVGWLFYKKGWGALNTLTDFVPGEGYIGIVPTASTWRIPQQPL